jgi:orotidine-5'-phosphate decarboxylase
MKREDLIQQIKAKKSCLCVGLDTDIEKIPQHLRSEPDPVYTFNKAIIDATADYAVAYKPNLAFYECEGARGWETLQKTLDYIPKEIFTIADAKRGDIGNTSEKYAHTFFSHYAFDAVTVAPYMGADSVRPFLGFKNKWVILLALTSNPGSVDFQQLSIAESGEKLYESVLKTSKPWGDEGNMMYVVGATQADHLKKIRQIVPKHFLLIPGVGAQGGNLQEVCKYGMNADGGLLINASRSILYAGSGADFTSQARAEAMKMQSEMAAYLEEFAFGRDEHK